MNELQLVDFETAKLLKERGFDWMVRSWFDPKGVPNKGSSEYRNQTPNCYSRPTVALAIHWVREAKGVHLVIMQDLNVDDLVYHVHTQIELSFFYSKPGLKLVTIQAIRNEINASIVEFPDYNTAEQQGLLAALKINGV